MKIKCIVVVMLVVVLGLTQVVNVEAADTNDGGEHHGSLAEKATDPTSVLTQFQLQNIFIPSTYDADGYSNQFILQPVLPMKTGWDCFPMQIIRPTLPLNVLTADPDGAINETSGVGDLTVFDLFRSKSKKWGA
jgi:hypothetical protein